MNTCKATLRVLFSHRAYLLIYLVFVGIMMLSISWSMLSGTSDSAAAAFEPAKMRVAVIDRDSDRGGIASSMRTYLSDSSELVNVDDASETLQQAVASNWVDLIVIIPDGFADDLAGSVADGGHGHQLHVRRRLDGPDERHRVPFTHAYGTDWLAYDGR